MFGENLVVIRDKLPREELLCQLAEEASELAQAALKLRRTLDGVNPTPTTYEEAYQNLKEEIADVELLIFVLGLDKHAAEYAHRMREKLDRWCKRLNGEV